MKPSPREIWKKPKRRGFFGRDGWLAGVKTVGFRAVWQSGHAWISWPDRPFGGRRGEERGEEDEETQKEKKKT